jgi:tripartite-type tricarboxylate transporter receptor subunit TctC
MHYTRRYLASAIGALAVAALIVPGSQARADAVADFYKGKVLTILLGHPPGGSYDLYAQLAAQYLGKYIPGNPKVVVEHRPGGGGGLAATYLFSKAPTDGSMIALLPETLGQLQLMDPKRSRWDMAKIKYIGRFADVNSAYGVRSDAPATTIEAMKTTPVNVGCSGRASTGTQLPQVAKNLLGIKFNLVCGYKGSGPFMLALERGEVDMIVMNWGTWQAKLIDQIKAGKYKIIAQSGLERTEGLEDVPLIQELIGDEKVDAVHRFLGGGAPIGRALLGAPGMPDDRVAALRAAFDKMVKDPEFLADAKKRQATISPRNGAQLDKFSQAILNAPKEVVALAQQGLTGYKANCPKDSCARKK